MAHTKRDTLPICRIKTIMKSSPGVENISVESVHLVAKATELFIRELAKESMSGDSLDYQDVAKLVSKDPRYEFLRDMIPPKITIREYKRRMNGKEVEMETSDISGESCSDESEDSS